MFINNIINDLYTPNKRNLILSELKFPANKSSDLIKDVDYKSTANKKKKIENLVLLNYSLKQFLSFDLSGRYKSIAQKKKPPDKDGVRIAELNEDSYKVLLWDHQPLTDFWQIGKGIAKRLV